MNKKEHYITINPEQLNNACKESRLTPLAAGKRWKVIMVRFALLILLTTFGCAREVRPDYRTPLGLRVVGNGHMINAYTLDQKYLDTAKCAGVDPYPLIKKIQVRIVKHPKTDPSGFQYWHCQDSDLKCRGVYFGVYKPYYITLPPDLRAAGHEFGHYFLHMQTHDYWSGVDESTCSYARNCGDKVDNYYNAGGVDPNYTPTPAVSSCLPYFELEE